MAIYPTELLEQLNGARMVVTTECEMCEVFAISYWHGGATVNYAVLVWGDFPREDVWTNYRLKKLSPSKLEKLMLEQLIADTCECVDPEVE